MRIDEIIVNPDIALFEKIKNVVLVTQVENLLEMMITDSNNFTVPAHQILASDDIFVIVSELIAIQKLLHQLPYSLDQTAYVTEKLLQCFD